MCDNVSAIAYLRNQGGGGHCVSTDVPYGHRYLRMGRKTVHDTDTQTSPWASKCVSRLSEPQRSNSENRMESESSRSTVCIPSFGQSTCGSVCTQVQHQASNIYVSDFRIRDLEGRESSPNMGKYVQLCVPTNGSDQTDSEQVDLAQSRIDPHSPLWPKQDWFPDLLRLSMDFPLVLPPTAKAIILSTLPSEAADAKPSHVEAICRSNQVRGFSEQVSNRIAVPQRKSTLDLYEQKWNIPLENTFRGVSLTELIHMHTPTVPMTADFLLHLNCLGTSSW